MKKITLFCIITVVTISISCHKKASTTPAATTTGINPVNSNGLYSGLFIAEKFISWNNGATLFQPSYLPMVVIPATPQSENSIVAFGANAGVVKSNNVQLQFNKSIKIYTDSTGTLSYSTQISFQHNSSTLGTINFMNPDTFPVYTKSLALAVKDTIDKTKNYVIPLNNLSYYNAASATILGLGGSVPVAKAVSTGIDAITFSPSELSALPSGNYCLLRVILKKFNDQTINDKLLRFENDSYNEFNVYVK